MHRRAVVAFDAWAHHPQRKRTNSHACSVGLLVLACLPVVGAWVASKWFRSLADDRILSLGLAQSLSLWVTLGCVLGLMPVLLNWGLPFLNYWLIPRRFEAAQRAVDTDERCDPVFKKRCLNLQARGVLDHQFNPIEWQVAHRLWSGARQSQENGRYLDSTLPQASATDNPSPRTRL